MEKENPTMGAVRDDTKSKIDILTKRRSREDLFAHHEASTAKKRKVDVTGFQVHSSSDYVEKVPLVVPCW